jgi:hypothetical protein
MDDGFDAAATYTVGLLTGELGPAGVAISRRIGSATRQMAVAANEPETSARPPIDVLYVRAGSLTPKELLRSPAFKRAVAQRTAILIEREAWGRSRYEELLFSMFSFQPSNTNAVLVRSQGEKNESWEVFLIEEEKEKSSASSTGVNAYSIDLNSIASVLQGHEIMREADESRLEEVNLDVPIFPARAGRQAWGRYHLRQGRVFVRAAPGAEQVLFERNGDVLVVDPATGLVDSRADACSSSQVCGSYGSSSESFSRRGPATLVNVQWWDNWTLCGPPTGNPPPTTGGPRCGTGFKRAVKQIRGYTESVGVEAGISVAAEFEAGIPFIVKTKTIVNVSSKATYNKTFYNQTETTYEQEDNVVIPAGYQARFGRGNWTARVSRNIAGRHERKLPLGPPTIQSLGADIPWWFSQREYFRHGCWDLVGSWGPPFNSPSDPQGRVEEMWSGTVNCPSQWNRNFSQTARTQFLRTFGVNVWAICKQTDMTCINRYSNGRLLPRAFPL